MPDAQRLPGMTRFATIDIGTNSVKLLIAERDGAGRFLPLLDTMRTTRLGEGFHARRLSEVAMRRTLDTLREYAMQCQQWGVEQIAAVGTASLRQADNQAEFLRRARNLGIDVEVIAGEEEARLSFLAVSRDPRWRQAGSLLVIDIGGGSTEVIVGSGAQGKILLRESLPIGAVRLTEATLLSDPPSVQHMASANRMVATALDGFEMRLSECVAVGVGGTLATMGAVHLQVPTLDPERIHGTRLTLADVEAQVTRYAALTIEERKQIVGLEPSRADIILGGAIILCHILCKTHLDAVAVSCRGLRWGVLYDRFGG